MKPLILGSRGSALALAQTRQIMAELQRLSPDQSFELVIIKTQGDRLSEDPALVASTSLSKGLFTAELERALLRNEIDLAIHSLKDLPTIPADDELILAAIPPRADARDVLITRTEQSLQDLPFQAQVATGSPRRTAQLKYRRPDLNIIPIRGNIDTRLRKFRENPSWRGLILAAAGLARLQPDLKNLIATPLPYEHMLPAPGQGALALQIRHQDTATMAIVQKIHHPETAAQINAERAFLRALGGGCQQPIAAHAQQMGGRMLLKGIAWLGNNSQPFEGEIEEARLSPDQLGETLAKRFMEEAKS